MLRELYGFATTQSDKASVVGVILISAVAIISGLVTWHCFSPRRTLGEFIENAEGNETDDPLSNSKKKP